MKTIKILNSDYQLIDTKEQITVADSWVCNANKVGTANGEAKLYVGARDEKQESFFGEHGFNINCFILKKDLLDYLNDYKFEYQKPSHDYRKKDTLAILWEERRNNVLSLNDILYFDLHDQHQIKGSRLYINSLDSSRNFSNPYTLIREIALPNISYISIIKLKNLNGDIIYYFKLFADIVDFFGKYDDPRDEIELGNVTQLINITEKEQLIKARIGQGKFRKQILNECPFCPITGITNQSLLVASHIKPWRTSDNIEKLDPKNGLLFTPTFDTLFDRGLITFQDDKRLLVSALLSSDDLAKLNINEGKKYDSLPIKGREGYLKYHRDYVFKEY